MQTKEKADETAGFNRLRRDIFQHWQRTGGSL
jgi:hypothetical protein